MAGGRLLLVGAVLAATAEMLTPGIGPSAAAAQPPMLCQAFGVSPGTQAGSSAMCVWADITRDSTTHEETSRVPHVTVSHDGGRTWTAMKALGLVPISSVDAPPPSDSGYAEAPGITPDVVIYSAGYAQDHTVYLSVYGQTNGLYKTTDDGDTWTFTTPIEGNDIGGPFTAYTDPRPGPVAAVALTNEPIALANRLNPDRFDGPMMTSEKGANPAWSRQFAYSERAYHGIQMVGVAEIEDPAAYFSDDITSVRSCTFDLDCSHVLHTFPVGGWLGPLTLAGDFGSTGRILVQESSRNAIKPLGWLESTDAGRTFHSWPFAARVDRDVAQLHGEGTDILLATNPHLPRVIVADVFYDVSGKSYERDYLSRDDGRHWAVTRTMARPDGYEWAFRSLSLAADGSLYLLAQPLGSHDDPWSEQDPFSPKRRLFCSGDFGRTWGNACR